MSIGRRDFLRLAGMGSVAGCACCLSAAGSFASEPAHSAAKAHAAPHWSYEGATGPDHWGELQPDFKVCDLGLEQTPIDLSHGLKGEVGSVTVDYGSMPLRIVNNGHTIQVNAEPGSSCTIGRTKYELLQFHFHHPSEHLLSGKPFDLECHFVHKAANGALAVIGVFVRPGAQNATLQPIFDGMPLKKGPEVRTSATVYPAALLPQNSNYFRYMGSLTTPPCTEGLTWTVYRDPIEASSDQIRQFASLFPNNARPVRGRNRRFVIEAY